MWMILTADSLLSRLSAPEHEALDRAAAGWAQEAPLDAIAHEVAEDWRGGLRRVTTLDKRPDAVPSEILLHILADFRYRAFTRLPGMRSLLDERRVAEWERAMAVRDALAKVSYQLPDEENREPEETLALPTPQIAVSHGHVLD